MSADRLQLAKDRLNAYCQAETAILSGSQEYRIGTRTLRRADLPEIRRAIAELERQIQYLDALLRGDVSRRVRRVVIRDI